MGEHPIRCGLMCRLRIALTLGKVAHATSGRTLRGVTAAVTALNLYINVIRISMILRCTLVQ